MKRKACRWIRPPGPVAPGLKIGLLGGSFNPAHQGHVHISELARKRLGLDYVWWLVAPQNPLKPTIGMAPLVRRLDFAREMARASAFIVVMDIERSLGTRYTIDTLRRLKSRFGGVHFVWLMGTDSLQTFHRWKRWPDIAGSVPIAVVMRPGSELAALGCKPVQRFGRAGPVPQGGFARAVPPAFTIIDGPRNPLSATEIRRNCQRGELFVHIIPA